MISRKKELVLNESGPNGSEEQKASCLCTAMKYVIKLNK